ncbi:glycosyltransferase [Candidatus Gracilibacteria bacterium]|nr:glycosyltransferase [Candidatus Gracilibacteria bacterium]
MNPKVSVIIPCYNEPENVFRRSLESVIRQTLEDIEIIIILDNPDNNELKDIIGEYQSRCDKIVLLTPENNLGRGNARNLGIWSAQGKYVAIHDADDIDAPERLGEQYDYMEENPEVGVVFSGTVFTDEQGSIIPDSKSTPTPESKSLFQKQLNHQTMFIKTEIIQAFGGYADINYGEDIDLWMRLYLEDIQMGKIDALHSYYLSPLESSHSDYIEKLKKWRLSSLQFYVKYFRHTARDPLFFRFLVTTLSDYVALHFGKKNYIKYRNFTSRVKNYNSENK